MSVTYEWSLRDASNNSVITSGTGFPPNDASPGSSLDFGSYYLRVEATDANGTTVEVSSVVEHAPVVNEIDDANAESVVLSGVYAFVESPQVVPTATATSVGLSGVVASVEVPAVGEPPPAPIEDATAVSVTLPNVVATVIVPPTVPLATDNSITVPTVYAFVESVIPSEPEPIQDAQASSVMHSSVYAFVQVPPLQGDAVPEDPELIRLRLRFIDEAGNPWQNTPIVTKLVGYSLINDSMIAYRGEYERTDMQGYLDIDRLKSEVYDFELIRPDGSIVSVRRQLPNSELATFSDTIAVN